jgi:hypothetical protein
MSEEQGFPDLPYISGFIDKCGNITIYPRDTAKYHLKDMQRNRASDNNSGLSDDEQQ